MFLTVFLLWSYMSHVWMNDSNNILSSNSTTSHSHRLNLTVTRICLFPLNHKFRFFQFPVISACWLSFFHILCLLTSPNPLTSLTSLYLTSSPVFLICPSWNPSIIASITLLTVFSGLSPLWPFGAFLCMCSGFLVPWKWSDFWREKHQEVHTRKTQDVCINTGHVYIN